MSNIKVLMITSEWPTNEHPNWVPFIVQQVTYLRKADIDVDVFSFRGSKKAINYIRAWCQVRKILNSKHYNLIHAQFGQSGLLALPKPLHLVVTFHGSDLQGDVSSDGSYTIEGKILRVVSKFVAFLADERIVVSAALGKILGRGRPCRVIPCGLDLDLFQPIDQGAARKELNLSQDKRLILFGGRPEMPVKRYELAQQAVNLIVDNDVEMIAINRVPHDQMPLYLNACDVLLLTSLHEGSPTIVKEALACNLPVVSTDVGDVRDLLESVDGCIVCSDDRAETIALGLMHVLEKRQRVNGRDAVKDLDEKIMTQKIIAVYQQVLVHS